MLKNLCCFASCTALTLVMASGVCAEGSKSETQVRVDITLYEEPGADAGKRVLAQPACVVTLGRRFSVGAGGRLNNESGTDPLEFGTFVRGRIERHGPDTLLVRLSLALGNAVSIEDAPQVQLVRTETFDVRAPMTIGEVTRIPCGESQTLEVRVKPVQLPADEPNVRSESSQKTSPADR